MAPPITKWKKRGTGRARGAGAPQRGQLADRGGGTLALLGKLATERDGSILAARGLHGIVVQSSEKRSRLRRGDLQGPSSSARRSPGSAMGQDATGSSLCPA